MKTLLLVPLMLGAVWTAAHAQTESNAPSAIPSRIPGRSSFQERLQTIVNRGSGFTKLAAMESRWGTVLIRNSTREGFIDGPGRIEVTSIAFTDTRTNHTEYGVRIDVTEGSTSATAYVDYGEMDALLNGLDLLGRIDLSKEPFTDAEASYSTNGGLRVAGAPASTGKFDAHLSVGRDPIVTVKLPPANFKKLQGLLDSAKARLDSAQTGKPK